MQIGTSLDANLGSEAQGAVDGLLLHSPADGCRGGVVEHHADGRACASLLLVVTHENGADSGDGRAALRHGDSEALGASGSLGGVDHDTNGVGPCAGVVLEHHGHMVVTSHLVAFGGRHTVHQLNTLESGGAGGDGGGGDLGAVHTGDGQLAGGLVVGHAKLGSNLLVLVSLQNLVASGDDKTGLGRRGEQLAVAANGQTVVRVGGHKVGGDTGHVQAKGNSLVSQSGVGTGVHLYMGITGNGDGFLGKSVTASSGAVLNDNGIFCSIDNDFTNRTGVLCNLFGSTTILLDSMGIVTSHDLCSPYMIVPRSE